MRLGKVFIDDHLVVLRRIGQPALPDVETVQQRLAVVGDGDDPGRSPVPESRRCPV